MKPAIARLALFIAACGGGSGKSSPVPTAPSVPSVQVDGGQLFTYGNAVAYLPTGIAVYRAAIVFLPGLRDPATGNDLDSRALVSGTPGGACSIWCSPAERAEVRRRALELASGDVALVGTTTLVDNPSSYETLLRAQTEPNAELTLAKLNGKLYLLGSYPASRQTARTVQIEDIASDHWELGPPHLLYGDCERAESTFDFRIRARHYMS